MLKRVDAYLEDHITKKSRMKRSFSELLSARPISSCGIGTDEELYEQPELLISSKAVPETILWQKSLQMRDEQQAWQVIFPESIKD